MRLSASDHYLLHQPSRCERRVFLAAHATEPYTPGPFEQMLFDLGRRHEEAHLRELEATHGPAADLSDDPPADARRHLFSGEPPVLYQAPLEVEAAIEGEAVTVFGRPDFLIRAGERWIVRDAKLSRHPTATQHPQVFRQLELYGWMLEAVTGHPPAALQVHTGAGELVPVPPADEAAVLGALRELLALRRAHEEPWTPVGWSKCGGCMFRDHCFPRAWEARDVALVPGVDQSLARVLREQGVETAGQLLDAYDADRLADLAYPRGLGTRHVGARTAERILRAAEAIRDQREVVVAPPELPDASRWVMFDLEGLPPYLEGPDTVYLWGMQVYGEETGPYTYALAHFDEGGDREGWEDFLEQAGVLLATHGDLPFVHWGAYERVKVELYLARYGDLGGIGHRVHRNLLDLLPITRRSVALPLPSYSLKVVEGHVGFERELAGYAGDQSIARWVQATETRDPELRQEIVAEVLAYNQEDLAATWAVLRWLRGLRGPGSRPAR